MTQPFKSGVQIRLARYTSWILISFGVVFSTGCSVKLGIFLKYKTFLHFLFLSPSENCEEVFKGTVRPDWI